ncbi:hypothetical protein V2647_06565 [Tenacibaculum maritimum]|uniref:hypothetical protein n=1 Tax=Tenacibaculum maritimum TaxID=107401 RepID=UPI0012E6C63A|nr:hypothetical protein [Tenacibaculum maritimum]MCD9583983.1 hypothetical protein [Tenacibaculum maritimum]MCD9619999.1 hypothetical protein [Tenacibaculum maritimum]MCD9626353.1 hypothetical protein [Tenacibaculum maritimum]MCD9628928.1 hypothetical protein [Tenacibaculum maritimum]MCD9631761.1 hypothetical protein [Tenacibaculum maritimum]
MHTHINLAKKVFSLVFLSIISFRFYAQEKPNVELHGALRFNYKLYSWNQQQQKRGGDIGYDMFAINPKASYKGLTLQVKYRLYAQEYGAGLLRQGDITYTFQNKDQFILGLTKVPFGITPYNSHSYYLSMGYYIGLEDDYDVGFTYTHKGKNIDYQLAFFKNSEDLFVGEESAKRYSYDVIGDYKETNQVNGKIVYKVGKKYQQQIGTSLMYGGLHNIKTNQYKSHYAIAVHYEGNINQFNIKAQATSFKKNTGTDYVEFGAYNATYNVASKGELYTLGASYNFPLKSKVFDNIQVYDNYAYFDKSNKEYINSFTNTVGILVHAGNIYSYIEFITTKNQPWFNEGWTNSFAKGDDKVQTLFNINVGYYF